MITIPGAGGSGVYICLLLDNTMAAVAPSRTSVRTWFSRTLG